MKIKKTTANIKRLKTISGKYVLVGGWGSDPKCMAVHTDNGGTLLMCIDNVTFTYPA